MGTGEQQRLFLPLNMNKAIERASYPPDQPLTKASFYYVGGSVGNMSTGVPIRRTCRLELGLFAGYYSFVPARRGNQRRVYVSGHCAFSQHGHSGHTMQLFSSARAGGLGFGGGVRDSQGAFARSGKRRRSVRIGAWNQARLGVLCISLFLSSCGGNGTSSSPPPPPPPTITSVTVAPSAIAVLSNQTLAFTATVSGTGAYSSAVTWAVNGIAGGNAQNGTINNGAYVAPAALPSTNPVTVTAASVEDPTKSGTAEATVFMIVITPTDPTLYYGQTQQFTATVTGLAGNPVVQWSALMGQINSAGLYSAPSEGTEPTNDTVSASVSGETGSASTSVSLQPIPPKLVSLSPSAGIVGQNITLNTEGLYNVTGVFFSLPNGVPSSAVFTGVSPTEIAATVPVGTADGPVWVQYTPLPQGGVATTNSVNFTRLPNLHIRAQNTELSSSETAQFVGSFLGGNTSKAIEWTADQGTINTAGLYQAPVVSAEGFATITGCITGTRACDSVMVHLLPFRIAPFAPTVSLGNTLQLEAIQGESPLSAAWSLPAADGTITPGGLFTAPNNVPQAGPIPVIANLGGSIQSASVGATGGFPGLVTRVWDYVNFNHPGNLGMVVETVAVSGNRAYCLDLGSPFTANLSYAAIDTYDLTDPHHPVWLNAVDATSNLPLYLSTYGNYLFTVDSGYSIPAPSRIAIYNIQGQTPVLMSVTNLPELAFSQVNNGVVYGLGAVTYGAPTFPVYTFDIRSGSVVQTEYDLTPAPGLDPGGLAITGSGNMIYLTTSSPAGVTPSITIVAYDISTTPPTVVGAALSDEGFNRLQLANQLLFVDGEAYDVSNPTPSLVASFPLISVQSVQNNRVLALGDYYNYVVIDVSNPANPVVTQNVTNLASENPFMYPNAALAGNNFITADAEGGFSVYDASAPGGPSNEAPNPLYQEDGAQFIQIYDLVVQPPTLYAAGPALRGAGNTGGLITYDVSGSAPNPIGALLYPNEVGLAVKVSGANAFLGLTDSLKVADVSNPSSPTEIASLALPVNALALSGNTLFVGTSDGRLVVVDVSNPAAPNQIGSVSITGLPNTMNVAGTLLFVADGAQGLLVFDISQPKSPALLSQFSLAAPVWDVAPSGSIALLAADALGLVIVDVSNPTQIKQLNQTALPPFNPFPAPATAGSVTLAASVAVEGGLVYVGTTTDDEDASADVAAFDFSQPSSPRLVAFRTQIGDDISVVSPSGNQLFLAANGIVVEYDNALPQNSIELYNPPAALAQSLAAPSARKLSKIHTHTKLNKDWNATVRQNQIGRRTIAPRCPVRSQCSPPPPSKE